MSVVRILSDDLVNQIAAGEVVERPASVVKELVENALDAGATRIDVAIAGGGMRWICVTDDGEGLARGDAERAFERHATSKIRATEDLFRVATLGFRGEALPSIAGVAVVRMRTRRADAQLGVELTGQGRGIGQVREIACAAGTRVEVSDLFGSVPARRKFLKSEITEATHVLRWLERIALARPDIAFALEKDGRVSVLFAPTADLRERVIAVLPASLGERLVAVRGELASASLTGFATPTDVHRGTTGDIHLLVNARPVRDRLLLYAVRQAYRDALPPGRHPAAVLYLNVEPGDVDVNVHPTKAEVRFRDPGAIRALVTGGLIQALGLRSRTSDAADYRPATALASTLGEARPPADLGFLAPAGAGDWQPNDLPGPGRESLPLAQHRYLGQALGTYLLVAGPGALLLLDQHAAHERVLFERLRRTLLAEKLERQALLVPIPTELAASDVAVLVEHEALLERAGFELEFGETTLRGGVRVAIRAVPSLLSAGREPDWPLMLEETAASLRDADPTAARDGIEGALHGILATAACHAAVRKGDRLEPPEVQALLEALDEEVWFPNCPHGRPILVRWPEPELERQFGRR